MCFLHFYIYYVHILLPPPTFHSIFWDADPLKHPTHYFAGDGFPQYQAVGQAYFKILKFV